jgi:YaiO family outer membrane protein
MSPALLLLVLQAATPADTFRHWRGELGAGADFHSTDARSTWTTARAGLGYRWARGGVNAELIRTDRFDQVDQTVGLEAYLPAGRRTALWLRAGVTPDAEVVPDLDLTVEATRAIAQGWEGSLRYRRMEYPTEAVNVFTGGAGLWRGQWYLRLQGSYVPRAEKTGFGVAFAARRYLDPRRIESTLDLFADVGREVVTLAPPQAPDLRLTTTIGGRWQRPLSRRAGLSFLLYRSTEEEAPDRIGTGLMGYLTW